MLVSDILRHAMNIIADPMSWTASSYARNLRGEPVSPFNHEAICWCAVGALDKTVVDLGVNLTDECIRSYSRLDAAAHELFNMPISQVNDELGRSSVLQTYKKAIDLSMETDQSPDTPALNLKKE